MKVLHHCSRIVAVVASVFTLGGCGGGSGTGGNYTLSSGTYRLSNISVTPPDDCKLAQDLEGGQIRISVSGSNVTFGFEDAPDASRDVVASIQGNDISTGSKT